MEHEEAAKGTINDRIQAKRSPAGPESGLVRSGRRLDAIRVVRPV